MDVACLGILVADVFANPIPRLPAPGELTTTSGFVTSVGGCAANVAVGLSILGRSATVAGKIGNDMLGEFVISDLTRRGVEVQHIRRTSKRSTSGTIIFTVEGEDRRYLHTFGANAEFSLDDIDFALLDEVRVLYIGGYLAMPAFTAAEMVCLLEEAKRRGLITVLDVVMPAGLTFGLEYLSAALPWTDFFVPNQDEAQRLTGRPDARGQAACLSALNPECAVVITRGRHGSLAKYREQFIETAPFAMESVDESGAGDAFAAGLITGLLEEWDLVRTLSFAGAVGASCTRAVGCSAGVFTFDEAVAFLESRTAKAAEMKR